MAKRSKDPRSLGVRSSPPSFQAHLDDIVHSGDWVESKVYEPLCASLEAELPEHKRLHCLRIDARVRLYEQIRDALPADMQQLLWEHEEAKDMDTYVQSEAAFLVGLEIGRRVAEMR